MDDSTQQRGPFLSSEDARALDGLVDSGLSLSPDCPGATTDRTRAVAKLLAALDLPPGAHEDEGARDLLINVTFARVLRDRDQAAAGRISPEETTGPALSEVDAAAIDRLESAGWAPDGDARASAAASLLELLETSGPNRGALVDETLHRIREDVEAQRMRFRLDPDRQAENAPARRSFRLADFGAIAAMMLLAFGILMPLLDGMRSESQLAVNAARMSQAGLGFGLFGADHDGRLPAAHESDLNAKWWDVGNADVSHSANLFTLVSTGYVGLETLASPGNPFAPTRLLNPSARDWRSSRELSYSYRVFEGEPPRVSIQQPTILLADRSPIVQRLSRGERVDPMESSPNHGGRGQHVLISDGRVRFLEKPVIGRDLLWLPREAESGDGGAWRSAPAGPADAFVGP